MAVTAHRCPTGHPSSNPPWGAGTTRSKTKSNCQCTSSPPSDCVRHHRTRFSSGSCNRIHSESNSLDSPMEDNHFWSENVSRFLFWLYLMEWNQDSKTAVRLHSSMMAPRQWTATSLMLPFRARAVDFSSNCTAVFQSADPAAWICSAAWFESTQRWTIPEYKRSFRPRSRWAVIRTWSGSRL